MREIQIFKEITTYFFIAIPGVPCPAKNQDLYGNDIHSQVVGTWDECGEYFAKSILFKGNVNHMWNTFTDNLHPFFE